MSGGLKRWNVLAARYNRAFCVLLLDPKLIVEEVLKPDSVHAVTLAVGAMLTAGAGLVYRISVAQWRDSSDD